MQPRRPTEAGLRLLPPSDAGVFGALLLLLLDREIKREGKSVGLLLFSLSLRLGAKAAGRKKRGERGAARPGDFQKGLGGSTFFWRLFGSSWDMRTKEEEEESDLWTPLFPVFSSLSSHCREMGTR